jgi:hypothetical protein
MKTSRHRTLVLWSLLAVWSAAGVAWADGLDVDFRLDHGRLGVRLSGETRGPDGDVWGELTFDDGIRGDIGWGVPVGPRWDRRRGYRGQWDREPGVSLRGDWDERDSRGEWQSYYWNDRRDGDYIGGRVRFVGRDWRRSEWQDAPYLSSRYRDSGRDDDRYAPSEDWQRDDRDRRGSDGDGWVPYEPGYRRGDDRR